MLRVRVLGGFDIWLDGRSVSESGWPLRRAKSLVKLLALSPGYWLHRDEVVESLWPESATEAASHSLHQTLYVARRVLGIERTSPLLRVHEDLVMLGPEEEVTTDLRSFVEAAGHARARHDLELCRRALALYGGDLLPGDRYQEWSRPARERVSSLYIGLLWETASLLESSREYGPAAEVLEELVAADPFSEEAYRGLMRCYALSGQRAFALRRYSDLKRTLAGELSVEPDESTQKLHEDILNGRLPADSRQPAMSRPPSAVSSSSTAIPAPRSNLARSATSFIGTRLIDDLIDELQSNRLVTLTGPEGSGKSRLAEEAAVAMVPEFPHGTWVVPAESLPDAASLRQMAFEALRARVELPPAAGFGEPNLHLQGRQALLILDGCDELREACGRIVRDILEGSSGIKIIATSRRPLGTWGETVWQLPRLSQAPDVPNPTREALFRYETTRLFLERLESSAPAPGREPVHLPAVSGLCGRIGGLPLAIEITAGQFAHHGAEVLASLLGAPGAARSRPEEWWPDSLERCIEACYRLLGTEEQRLLRALAGFDGPFTGAAAQALYGDGPESDRQLGFLAALTSKHLLTSLRGADGTALYRMPGAVRRFARTLVTAAEGTAFQHLYSGYQSGAFPVASPLASPPALGSPTPWPGQVPQGSVHRLAPGR